MTEALQLLLTRRSVPALALQEPAPSGAALENILTAATRVPDHGKLAPWRLILIAGDARDVIGETISAAFQDDNPQADDERIDLERNRLSRAPIVICVVSTAGPHAKIPEWEQVLSAGAVCMNMLNAAHAQGFAAQWLTEWYAYDERVRTALAVQENEQIAGFIHIGTPGEKPAERPRPKLGDIVTRLSTS